MNCFHVGTIRWPWQTDSERDPMPETKNNDRSSSPRSISPCEDAHSMLVVRGFWWQEVLAGAISTQCRLSEQREENRARPGRHSESACTSRQHLNKTMVNRPDSSQHKMFILVLDGPTTGKLAQREWPVKKGKLSGNCAERTSDKVKVRSVCLLSVHKAQTGLETCTNHRAPIDTGSKAQNMTNVCREMAWQH